ncbi:MAG TPA: histidine kinase [Paucimonas sp.]|nr:histidine kinase [Paucimonas sp.]
MNTPTDNRIVERLHEIQEAAGVYWWRFVDWVAVVSWPKLAFIWALALLIAAPFGAAELPVLFIFVSLGVKVMAGGKRRADIAAREASERVKVESLERRLLEAQIAMLQAQIEPHFLFNTLALIGRLIETDPSEAARIHAHLIEYLRSALPQMRETGGSTLGRQVELSRAYLAIMQARMKERLAVSIDVPLELADAPFPPMMLQVLVENAIKHGLEPKTQGGRVEIRARAIGDLLCVDVTDDGVGFDLHAGDGIGLANLRERLKVLFGRKAQLVIEAPASGGAYVSIRVPYLSNVAEEYR